MSPSCVPFLAAGRALTTSFMYVAQRSAGRRNESRCLVLCSLSSIDPQQCHCFTRRRRDNNVHTLRLTDRREYTRVRARASARTLTHARTHAPTLTHIHTHALTGTYTHTHAHAHTHTYTHTHTRARARARARLLPPTHPQRFSQTCESRQPSSCSRRH